MKKTDIFNELHTADLYVLSSRRENFSVAIIEATANGLPTIATLCGGTDEYPVSECTKIPVDDVQALKEALEYKYDTRESVDRKKIQEETLHYFSPSAIVSQLEDVYNSVLLQNK